MTKINRMSPALWRRLLFALMIVAWSIALEPSPLFAQNIQHTENKPDLALRSDIRVDPSTLGMSFSIPLASYPGRAGHGLPVAITYFSKVLRLDFQGVDSTPVTGAKTWTGVEFAEHSTAGWTSTLTPPRVEFTGMGQFYDGQGRAACPDVCVPGQTSVGDHYIKRIHVHMPDGSSHELRLDDQTHFFPVATFTGTFQAVDGSRMRFESNAGTASVLYLPDGSLYLFGAYNDGNELTATHFIDRNGNTLTYNTSTRQWTDTLNRVIANPLPANPAANTETYFLAKLVGGNDAPYKFRWKYLADVLTPDPMTGLPPPLRYPGDNKCAPNSYQTVSPSLFTSSFDTRVCVEQDQFGNPVLFNPVVLAEIELPTGKFYRFSYTVYGEIDKILLTTGATDRFRYNQVATLSSSTGPYRQINRGAIERRVSATGSGTDESLWTYAVISTNPYTVRTTRPDLSYSERLLHRSRYSGVGEDFARFEFDDARMGMVYEERSYNSSGSMLRRDLAKWVEGGPLEGGYSTAARDAKVTRQVSILLDGTGTDALTATKVNRYEQTSQPLNLTSTTEYAYNTMSKTTAQTAGVDSFIPADSSALRTTETAYLDDADYNARNLVSLPTSVAIKSGMPASGQVTARSEMLYDDPLLAPLPCGATAGWSNPGAVARGNVTTVKSWLNTLGAVTNPSAYLATHTQYDQCGSVRKTWDARDTALLNPTEIEYSHEFAYPTLNTSPDPDATGASVSLTTSTEYDVSTGLVKATIDANRQKTEFSYNDPLNRLTKVVRAATDTGAKNQSTYSYDDNTRTITVTSDLNTYEDNLLKTVTKYDGLGRLTETQTFEDLANYIATQQQYDISGRVFKTSNPFRPLQMETPDWTITTYDSLSRVLTVKAPDNAVVTSSYSGNTVTITDQAQRKRKSVTDALGRMIEVYEDPNGLNYQTTYLYDVLDDLVKVTQGSQQRFFMYDSLKRLIRSRNPEQEARPSLALSDPITGNSGWSIAYVYDANGNLTQKTDARGVESTYTYDALNRNIRIDYSDTPLINPDVSRFYDGATNGKGRIWSSYAGGTEDEGDNVEKTVFHSYDALGRPLVLKQSFKVNGVWINPDSPYQISRTYNLAGAVATQTYPSGHSVTYNYDAAGRLADKDASNPAFTGTLGDGVPRTYAREVKYSSWGSLSRERYGTGIPVYHKLRYTIRGQLCDVRASNVDDDMGGELGALVNYYGTPYTHCGSGSDNNGNVLMSQTIINSVMFEDRYDYDALNRLTAVNEFLNGTTPSGSQQYNYDRWSNRNIIPSSTALGFNTSFDTEDATNRLYAPGDLALAEDARRIRYDKAGNQIKDTFTGYGEANFDADNHITAIQDRFGGWSNYTYNADGQRTRRKINNQESWHIYGIDGELLAEYAANAPPASPRKEYGYRNGQLLITAEASSSGPNFASAGNGATATASSTFGTAAATNANNGDHVGSASWWADDTSNTYPDWIQVDFAGAKTISEIDVYGLQQNYGSPVEPTLTMTSTYALTNFEVQYWTGSTWATVAGGSVTGNDKVWRKFTFAPLTTSKVRVYVTNVAGDNRSQVVELEAYGPPNVAAASSGATATVSSTFSTYVAGNAINGDHIGNAGLWVDDTSNVYPDWIQVDFSGLKTISEIDVFGIQQNYSAPVEPTPTMTSSYALTNFEVQYWTGSAWATVPGGNVTGNDKVWRKFTFAPLTTNKIRVYVTSVAGDNRNHVVELEAYTAASGASIQWLVTDHLGTPRMVIDQTGTLANVKRHDYLPFGEELLAETGGRTVTQGYSGGDGVRQQFTAYERDNETMLDFAQARYFAAVQARFTSADPFLGSGQAPNPQTWNRYSYSLNNPLRYVDPSGLLTVGVMTEEEQEQERQQSQSQTQPQQPVQQPTQPATSVPSPQVPTSVTITGPQANTLVNIPVDGKFFNGVGSILQLTIRDQNGRPIPNVTVMESVTPSTTDQNPNPVTSSTGTISDVVGVGERTSTPLTRQQAGNLIVPILVTPTTVTQTHSMRIISPSSGVMAIATHQRTLSNIDSQGNLNPYVNPSTGRSMSNFTLTISPVTVTRVPIVMSPRVVIR